jgi:PKD repeat protein
MPSAAADCIDKTCVDVFTEDNQLIITAQKGAGKPTPKPATKKPVVKPKPVITIKPTPKPAAKPKPVVTKKAIAKPVAKPAAVSLSDKLVKLLPFGDINFQPEADPLVNLPVYFWTQTPTRFTALVPILDVVVYVNLTPTFTWSFGDGGLFVTTMQGAPFPIGGVTHTYKKSGDYSVNLRVTWNGTFSVNGITTPISGNAITQSINRTISVAKAPTRFTE